MIAVITDHIWNIEEVLSLEVFLHKKIKSGHRRVWSVGAQMVGCSARLFLRRTYTN
jgi:hypothetical protein